MLSMKTTLNYVLLLLSVTSLYAQNIALQKPTTTSSVRANNQGAFAVDGNQFTRWESDWSDPQFLLVDLGSAYTLKRVEIDWEAAYATHYQVQLSNNKQHWTTASNISGSNGGTDVIDLNGASARYVRMYGTQRTTIGGAQYGFSIFEFEVYGEVATNNASLSNIFLDGVALAAFSSNQYNYNHLLATGVNSIPVVTAATANSSATYSVTNAQSIPGTTTINVTSADGSASQTYSINFEENAYNLMWSDEFDYNGAPSSSKWHHQTYPPNEDSWFNDEQQHYTALIENSYVSNGSLKIKAIKESYRDPTSGSTKQYTAARLNSKYAFKYGRMEVRAKLPAAQGTWPAIWTLGKNISENGAYWQTQGYGDTAWPACGEIDIMEQDGDKSKTSGAFHFPDSNGNHIYTTNNLSVSNTDSNWHVYAMDWNAETIELSVDGTVFHTLNNAQNPYFDNEHFILLNIAMGGQLGGTIPDNFTSDIMEIDYVRVYQLRSLSSGEIDNQNIEVSIYPNPSMGQFYIEAADVINEIVVYDLTGRILSKQHPLHTKETVSIHQSPGVYIIKVTGAKFEKVNKVIIN
jgi:beta-glucanase (GH16 family)